jgi:hypothetical protein
MFDVQGLTFSTTTGSFAIFTQHFAPRLSPQLYSGSHFKRYGERGLPFGLHFDSVILSKWLRPLSLNNRSMIDNKGNGVVPSQMRLVPRQWTKRREGVHTKTQLRSPTRYAELTKRSSPFQGPPQSFHGETHVSFY